MDIVFTGQTLSPADLWAVAFRREEMNFSLSAEAGERVQASHTALMSLLERKVPVYGVTTGFGDSGTRAISFHQSEELQRNLVNYLLCGTGPVLSPEVSRAILAVRVNSLSRAYSGVSIELIERMMLHLQNDWLPLIPREGSLGASGDLIPLAYLAQNIQGEGKVFCSGGVTREMSEVLREAGVEPYRLKAKEGLALVNGTSAMAGQFAVNLSRAKFLLEGLCRNSAWLCLALRGRTEAFESLVNAKAKRSPGQNLVAEKVRALLREENYSSKPLSELRIGRDRSEEWLQDRYSLRCVPQILGPVAETLDLLERWLSDEINSASDNPVIDGDSIANGGNFYGGYLSQGMDYLKISLAHMADLIDRQVAYVIDEKSNRGLPANLADWENLPAEERNLHHGLKGLHQSTSALTSEIMNKATPGGIFSRSSESHNQDKVSLGMSTAVQCSEMLEQMYTVFTLQSVILAQALDLRGVELKGSSLLAYSRIRETVPFVSRDQALGDRIQNLRAEFLRESELF